jgi:DNA-binding transcriptional regulator LsrR (DeoR family)
VDYYDVIKAAYLYYYKNYTQTEIGKIFGVSKMTISRMLQKARDENIVEIKINMPHEFNQDLQKEFIDTFPLKDVFIAKNIANENVKALLGRVGAYCLNLYLENNDLLGVGGSETLAHLAENIEPYGYKINCIVQLMGSLENLVRPYNSFSITQTFTEKFKVEGCFFSAPARLEKPEMKNILLKNSQLKKTTELWKKCTVALIGIGGVKHTMPRYFLSIDEFQELKRKGAVGDILGKFFDLNGKIVNEEMNSIILSISLEELKQIDRVIAVAGGENKIESILGALNTGAIDILVTDEDTAIKVLKLKNELGSSG